MVHVENNLPLLAQDIPSLLTLDIEVTNIGTEDIRPCDATCFPLKLIAALSADDTLTNEALLDWDTLPEGQKLAF